ncbi:MAG: flavodoxin family protein, partial [Oscillospiraceae bacterium]
MKFLILNGSPHRGNTWQLVQAAKAHILACNRQAQFEEIHLAAQNLPFCCGCSNCFRLGGQACPHSQVVQPVIKAIQEADGVIVASTTYFMRETGLLKNFFDHLCFMTHRPAFFKSKALVLTTTGGVGGGAAAKSIASFLLSVGFNRCYRFSAATFSWNDYQMPAKTKLQLEKMAGRFYRDISGGKLHSPPATLLIPYNLFRGMGLAYTKGSEYETEDGTYWTQPGRRKGVYDASVPVPF